VTSVLELGRAPRTDDELWHLIKALWGVSLPRVQVCPDHVSPFKAVADAYFGRAPGYAVWYASRGSGKSMALAILGLTKTLVDDVDTTILGGSMTQSQNVATHMSDLLHFKRAPVHALKGGRIDKGVTATQITTSTGRRIRPIPASQTTVRGPHPPLSLLDEVDEMEWPIYEAAMGQAMEQVNSRGETIGEYIVASSTWQHPDATFTRVMEHARKKGLPIYTWCWRELLEPHGWMTKRFIDQKRQAVTEEMWRCLPTDEPVQTRRGDVVIQDIQEGDEVWTRQGWREVTALVRQHDRRIYTVSTDDGRFYRATSNHKAATPDGWTETGFLRVGDTLLTADPPHGLTLAGPAVSMPAVVDGGLQRTTVAVDAEVASVVEVPLAGVIATADGHQVAELDAAGDVTGVVHGHVVWQRSVPREVGQPVGVVDTAHLADSVAVLGDGSSPDPAAISTDLRANEDVGLQVARTGTCHVVSVSVSEDTEPTWDISVDGTHEFTVRGIVVHNTEYELNEPSGTSRAFDLTKLEECFTTYPPALDYTENGEDDQEWLWEEPQPNASYAVGADWAKEVDKTVIVCIRYDVHPRRIVYLRRVNRQSYPNMIGSFDKIIKKFNAVGLHDKTGLGNVVHDFSDVMESGEVGGFNFSDRRKRSQMLLGYITDVEHGGYALPRGDTSTAGQYLGAFHRAHRATTTVDVYGTHMAVAPAGKHHLPDDVAAMGLAHRAAGRIPTTLQAAEVPLDTAPRKVDRPFHTKPFDDDQYLLAGPDVTIVDDRYEAPIADFSDLFNLSI
jgi:hypothetical protein